jgi:uncharacterized membrane protein
MEGKDAANGFDCTVVVRPNCSLTPAARRSFLVFIASVSLAIALAFAWAGAWPVLPFAGVEVGVLVWAFREIGRHDRDYEKISICGDRVLVERREADCLSRHEFNRHWVRLVNRRDGAGNPLVVLRSHGREVELGRTAAPAARQAVLHELRAHLTGR